MTDGQLDKIKEMILQLIKANSGYSSENAWRTGYESGLYRALDVVIHVKDE